MLEEMEKQEANGHATGATEASNRTQPGRAYVHEICVALVGLRSYFLKPTTIDAARIAQNRGEFDGDAEWRRRMETPTRVDAFQELEAMVYDGEGIHSDGEDRSWTREDEESLYQDLEGL